jgi:hypothetical protein
MQVKTYQQLIAWQKTIAHWLDRRDWTDSERADYIAAETESPRGESSH